jgi:hypothetical protein
VRSRNCHCGIVAHANCTRCGNGVCISHYSSESYVAPGFNTSFGRGKTLAEAAWMKGYWKTPREQYLCKSCRTADAKQHQLHVAQLSRPWPKTPFGQAMMGAAYGYVITEPALTYGQAVSEWLRLNRPLEDIAVRRLVRPEKFKQDKRRSRGSGSMIPAEYATDRYQGWAFPGTISVFTGHQMHTDAEIWSWGGTTYILPDGRALYEPTGSSHPASPARLIVEMARKLSTGLAWHGPPRGWE